METLTSNHAALSLSAFDNTVKVQGATNLALVTVANIKAGASIIHIVDAVLVPLLPDTTYPTIASAASAYGLTALVNLVSRTPLFPAVTDPTTALTVFAPTDEVR